VPVVDLADYLSDDPDRQIAFIADLGDAMRGFGFVRLRGHGVAPDLVKAAYDAATAFFHQPVPVKARYVVDGGGGERGYTPFGREHAKGSPVGDLKEFWHTGRELPAGHNLAQVYPPNLWPTEVPGFRKDMLGLYTALEHAAYILLEALAEYLGEEPDTFGLMVENGNTILRALRYPPMGAVLGGEGAVRAAAHEDINFITLLVTSTSAGLELLTRDGRWLPVNAEPGEIIADVGDMMSRVTNGFLPSTTHRVVNPDDSDVERYSLPFFVHPRPDTVLRVLPSCVGEGFPEPQPEITGYGFLLERLRELGLVGG
jgi:isopenicillin N synthase-like dioxygenase